jgi:hypothetical protein
MQKRSPNDAENSTLNATDQGAISAGNRFPQAATQNRRTVLLECFQAS